MSTLVCICGMSLCRASHRNSSPLNHVIAIVPTSAGNRGRASCPVTSERTTSPPPVLALDHSLRQLPPVRNFVQRPTFSFRMLHVASWRIVVKLCIFAYSTPRQQHSLHILCLFTSNKFPSLSSTRPSGCFGPDTSCDALSCSVLNFFASYSCYGRQESVQHMLVQTVSFNQPCTTYEMWNLVTTF